MLSNSSSFGSVRPQSVRKICLEIVTGHNVPLLNLHSQQQVIFITQAVVWWSVACTTETTSSDTHRATVVDACWALMLQSGRWGVPLGHPLLTVVTSPGVAQAWSVLTVNLMVMGRFGF